MQKIESVSDNLPNAAGVADVEGITRRTITTAIIVKEMSFTNCSFACYRAQLLKIC
jgi:hypothetical protein